MNIPGIEIGIIYMVILIVFFAYTGQQIGDCWVTMIKRWPIYQQHCRKPYPEIALRCMGKRARYIPRKKKPEYFVLNTSVY